LDEAFLTARLHAVFYAAAFRVVFLAGAFFTEPLPAVVFAATLPVVFFAATFFTGPLRAVVFVATLRVVFLAAPFGAVFLVAAFAILNSPLKDHKVSATNA
jgi:hypothetical protein